jgi:hypothetical protein
MRRVRPWVVVAGCLIALAVAAALVVRTQGELLRESAANYLRERLAAEFGAQFQTAELRGRWFPPGLSLGRVTFQPSGEAWVLTAEDVRLSFNLYAMLFRRERLGRVVLERPRLFVRAAALSPGSPSPAGPQAAPPAAPAAGAPAAGPPALAARLRGFLRPPFPVRMLEVVDGRVELLDRAGRTAVADGLDLGVIVSRGSAAIELSLARLALRDGGREISLEGLEAEGALEDGGATVSRLSAARGPLTGSVRGSVDYGGKLALQGDLVVALGPLTALVGKPVASGTARFTGSVAGPWDDPDASGVLALTAPALRGRRWPDARGTVSWTGRRLSWSDVRVAAGAGAITLSGSADLSEPRPRYRLDARAQAAEVARLAEFLGPRAEPVLGLDGTLRWEGAGTGADAQGGGTLEATAALAPWPGEKLALQATASLAGGVLSLEALRLAGGTLEASGRGAWRVNEGFTGSVSGAVADLSRLQPAAQR